ncbi:hypothetical protein EX895_005346 [Sporisorium graminicola]|uniref:SAP domain-containing protein n=1 Tax=Sporisorium graminicola TaxID=280036 RepID=A0A4U7KN00_9BASI|nr:hypothetical protein EX895_005346 [Sporisorium graminicola]TKY85805.1 hypothetical protein EX895_005346 [Sporisorium graminicola]
MNANLLLSPDALHCLKRKQLTNLCRRFGIKAVGKNADLIQRLQHYAASNIPADSPTKGNVAILRHVKRPRQSDSSQESVVDDQQPADDEAPTLSYPPLTPRTRQKRVSDLVHAIEQVKQQDDGMDTDDDDEQGMDALASQRNTIAFPTSSRAPPPRPLLPPLPAEEEAQPIAPLRIVKALPSSTRIASPLSTATILEMSTRSVGATASTSNLYPDLSTLPLPQGVSSDCLASSSTLPSITSRQFSAAAASVLAEMNARLTAAGRSITSGSLATMSSMGNATWSNLAASASSQGMSKSRSGRYEIHHERQFHKMDSIVNHYAAKRVGAASSASAESTSKPNSNSESASKTPMASTNTSATAAAPRQTPSTSTSQRRARIDASTSTRGLAAMAHSTSARKLTPVRRRTLPIPPTSQAKLPPTLTAIPQPASSRQASASTTSTRADPPRAKRLRLAVTEDSDALQNTVLEIPPEKKTVVIRVTRPEREGMPYKVSVADGRAAGESGPIRAASSLRKTVIKATKSTFVGSGSSSKKMAASAHAQKREAAFAKQQQQAVVMSRSLSSRANIAGAPGGSGMPTSPSVRNKFTGIAMVAESATCDTRKPSAALSTMSGATTQTASTGTSNSSSRFGGSIRSSVSQGLGRAEAARQARLKEIKARTKAALAGFGSQRNVSAASTTVSSDSASTLTTRNPAGEPAPTVAASFSPSVTKPTISSLNRAAAAAAAATATDSNASASLPILANIRQSRPLSLGLDALPAMTGTLLQRAATIHAGVGSTMLAPCLTPRSSSLRHLRRVMRKQQKQADLEHERVAAAENIAPGAVVPSVVVNTPSTSDSASLQQTPQRGEGVVGKPSIRTVAVRAASPTKSLAGAEKFASVPNKLQRAPGTVGRPAGPRAALVASRATTSALNRF